MPPRASIIAARHPAGPINPTTGPVPEIRCNRHDRAKRPHGPPRSAAGRKLVFHASSVPYHAGLAIVRLSARRQARRAAPSCLDSPCFESYNSLAGKESRPRLGRKEPVQCAGCRGRYICGQDCPSLRDGEVGRHWRSPSARPRCSVSPCWGPLCGLNCSRQICVSCIGSCCWPCGLVPRDCWRGRIIAGPCGRSPREARTSSASRWIIICRGIGWRPRRRWDGCCEGIAATWKPACCWQPCCGTGGGPRKRPASWTCWWPGRGPEVGLGNPAREGVIGGRPQPEGDVKTGTMAGEAEGNRNHHLAP